MTLRIEYAGARPGLAVDAMQSRLDPLLVRYLMQATALVQAAIVDAIASTDWKRPTGALGASFRPSFIGKSGTVVSAGVFSDQVYARVQDEGSGYLPGGVIVPREKAWLTIPLMRLPKGLMARDMPDLVVARSRKGQLFLVRPKAKRAALRRAVARKRALRRTGGRPVLKGDTLVWLLAKSVRIEGRHYLARAAEVAEPQLADLFERVFAENLLTEAGPGGSRAA